MFGTFDPDTMTLGEIRLNRRSALLGLGRLSAFTGTGVVLGAASLAPETARARNSLNLDFRHPDDNLRAWTTLASSLEDGKETCGFFSGTRTR